jgi:hypothetical protein
MSDAECYNENCCDVSSGDNTKFIITYNNSRYVIPYEKLSEKIAQSIVGRKKGKTLSDKVRFTIRKQISNEKPELLSRADLEEPCHAVIKYLLEKGSLEEYLIKKDISKKRKNN